MKKQHKSHAFTLVELLVVIAIIGLLAGLLFPAVNAALNTAKKTKARNTALNIESAVVLYANEYNGRFPIQTYGSDSIRDDANSRAVLLVLMNLNVTPNNNYALNPRRMTFLETDVPSSNGSYLDPWGTQYRIILDENMDGRIVYRGTHRKKVVVVSAGKDKTFGLNNSGYGKDDVANVDLN